MSQSYAKEPKDHGQLLGLADDDHTQYLTEARHSALRVSGRWYRSAADGHMSIATATTTTAIFPTEEHDLDDTTHWSMNTTTGILTINTTGRYIVSYGCGWNSQTPPQGYRRHQLIKDVLGAGITDVEIAGFYGPAPSALGFATAATSGPLILTATDKLRIDVTHTAGINLNLLGLDSHIQTWIAIEYVGTST